METETEKRKPCNGQLISVAHKDTIRLLEVYVKRSLSLNDGTLGDRRAPRKEKWVTIPRKHRRHSSDPSLHLAKILNDGEIGTFTATEERNHPDIVPEEPEKVTKKSKKSKKPSLWKSFLGLFSRKGNEDKDEEQENPSEVPDAAPEEDKSDLMSPCLPVTAPIAVQKRKSVRRKSLKRRLTKRRRSLIKLNRQDSGKEFNPSDITGVEAVVSVEPTYSYYEKVSEELEKILHEVKVKEEVESLTDEEVINRIIALTKEQGDAIDDKMKDIPALNNFFQRMSYSSFQKLADAYLETEASPIRTTPTVLPTAPELVKLAFTLDFTARIAGLSRQNIGHITCLGNRYLQDRFEYKQACTDHPWSDSDD
ncbi:uncharacterized protein ACBR49_007070 [Aulostomus maculatus]